MRIAIVDDIGSEREALSMRLTLQLNRLALHADISGFESGRDFLSAAKEEPFDLVFLDIYMDGENGVDTAKELRLFDQDCLLVFTTTSTDHALDGFRVRAFQYLVKPYSDRELEVLFDELMARLPEPTNISKSTSPAGVSGCASGKSCMRSIICIKSTSGPQMAGKP